MKPISNSQQTSIKLKNIDLWFIYTHIMLLLMWNLQNKFTFWWFCNTLMVLWKFLKYNIPRAVVLKDVRFFWSLRYIRILYSFPSWLKCQTSIDSKIIYFAHFGLFWFWSYLLYNFWPFWNIFLKLKILALIITYINIRNYKNACRVDLLLTNCHVNLQKLYL